MREYVARGFGDRPLTGIAAWLTYSANAIVTAMVAVSFGSYASAMVAGENLVWAKVFAALIVVVVTVVNIVGSELVDKAQTVIVYVVLCILALFAVGHDRQHDAVAAGVRRLSAAAGDHL